MSVGQGYGKTILFGEHFVVYGLPGIASGIDLVVNAHAERIKSDVVFVDNVFHETVSLQKNPESINLQIFRKFLQEFSVDGVKITIESTVVPRVGMGYSAALAVAVVRSLNKLLNLNLSDDEINEQAYKCEKTSHGTPSGIDNTAAVYGGIIWFKKNLEGGENILDLLEIQKPVEIVLGDTGLASNTKEVVADVRKQKQQNTRKYRKIFDEYTQLVHDARKALQKYNLEEVGGLMNQNHRLLQEITVSCKELDELVETARKSGALGAKLTGKGRGGLMVALTPGAVLQERVAKAIGDEGYTVFKTRVGV